MASAQYNQAALQTTLREGRFQAYGLPLDKTLTRTQAHRTLILTLKLVIHVKMHVVSVPVAASTHDTSLSRGLRIQQLRQHRTLIKTTLPQSPSSTTCSRRSSMQPLCSALSLFPPSTTCKRLIRTLSALQRLKDLDLSEFSAFIHDSVARLLPTLRTSSTSCQV